MKKYTLKAAKREVAGRKVKTLRAVGNLPATVYGKKIKSESLSVAEADFNTVYAEAGETGLVDLIVDGDTRPVLIHNVQKDPLRGSVLHIEFHQVDLKEKVHASIPLELVGEAPIVTQKTGVLLSLLSEIEVEALPADLPEKIEVDVSKLTEIDQELKVADLSVPSSVTVISDGAVGVVKVVALVSKEAEEQAAQEAAAAEAAAPAEEGAEPTTEEAPSGTPPEKTEERKTEEAK